MRMPPRRSSGVVRLFFFFQAEDGIRDYKVTGVQTCALPICVKFHDGSLFTADDVLFSLRRARSATSDMRSLLTSITDVTKVDAFTVHIRTNGPNPLLPASLINIQILSAAWAKAHGAEQPQNALAKEENYATRNANGTGPYVIASREQDTRTVLRQFPGNWGKRSEEHTSELQSPCNLVCRLLL